MRSSRSSLLAATFIVALTAQAHAGPTLPSTLTYTGYSVLYNQTVTLNDPSVNVINETGGAGQVNFTGTNTQSGSVLAWCIDITHRLLPSGTFTTGTVLQGDFAQTANALLSHFASALSISTNASAAMQVALWEAKYGTGLKVSGPQAVLDLATSFLDNVKDGDWKADPTLQLSVLDAGNNNQTQVTLTKVPEPASLGLLGTALFAVAGLRRRAARRRGLQLA